MDLKIAQKQHISQIMELIEQARTFLSLNGVDQWQNGYPDRSCIESDIQNKTGYLCVDDEKSIGYVCIDFNGESAYETLKGSWLSNQPYMVVHRLALDRKVRGQGFASQVFALAEQLAAERNIHSFKIDTDVGNVIMKHLLQKNGFTYCGVIQYVGSEKIAFEKLI